MDKPKILRSDELSSNMRKELYRLAAAHRGAARPPAPEGQGA